MSPSAEAGPLRRFAHRVSQLVGPPSNGTGLQVKSTGSGVQFIGAPDWRQVVRLDSEANPDAEELTRSIALATSAYAYTAIMYRAERMGEPLLGVVEETEDGEQTVEHELDMLLREPSPDYDMGELLQLTEIYRLVSGGALWVKEEDTAGRLARLVPFSQDQFKTESGDGRIYGRFVVTTASGPRTYQPEQVVHFRDLNPNSWRRGLSRLDVALQHLDLGHQVNRTVRNYMRKAMFPGGVISPHQDWNPDDDEWESFKAAIAAWHSGPGNAGEALVVEGGTTFSQTALGMKDLLPNKVLDRIEAVVGSVFGVPPVVLGWQVGLENSPWSQMAEARQMTYEDTIEPRWKDVQRKVSRQLLPIEDREAGRRIQYDTQMVRAFQADDKTRAEVAKAMRQEWTRNERRVYTGQDPLPPEDPRGDEIGEGVPSLGGGILGDEDTEEGELSASMALLLHRKGELDAKGLHWLRFDIATKAAQSTWERTLAKMFEEARRQVLQLAERHLFGRKQEEVEPDAVIEFIAAVSRWTQEEGKGLFRETTLPLVVSTGETAVKQLASQVGLSFATLQPALLEYAAEEADFLADVMGETTGRQVAETVQKQLERGGLIRDMRKALQEERSFTRTRAQLVARTETTRAWNGSQRRTMSHWHKEEAGDDEVVWKEWLSSGDPRVRPEHQELNGERKRIDELFSNGLQAPGEPNCRCTLIYTVGGEEESAPAPTQGAGG